MKLVKEIFESDNFNPSILQLIKLCSSWKKVMGDFIGENSSPVKLSDGLLVVAVEDSIWINEFSFMKKDFVDRLHDFGYSYIKDIKFVINKNRKNVKVKRDLLEVTDEILVKVEDISSVIKDANLRLRFKAALVNYFRNIKSNLV
ncbi:MAG: DUF721 domain-containing protein [Calditerrivibrio sp.]|nr:DUF721 domain-containing protein [Calditerrivibrio sp.]MCA1980643.1 DUF721 domain-containing protein [Calditerrivibrio sp.]